MLVSYIYFSWNKSSTNSSQRTHHIILCFSTLKLHEANTALKYPLPTCSLNDIETKQTIYEQACPHEEWQQATSEIHALHINQTWSLVPQPPKCNLVGNKWVYRIKQKLDSSIYRYKVLLPKVKVGIDFYETFSLIVKATTIHTILALAVHYQWSLHLLDVSNAFLHGSLNEDIYMAQPTGFVNSIHPDNVYKLKRFFISH